MDSKSLKSGICPTCNSTEIYKNAGMTKHSERMTYPASLFKWFHLDAYLCIKCGHFEEFITDENLKDEKIIEKIKETWKKVRQF